MYIVKIIILVITVLFFVQGKIGYTKDLFKESSLRIPFKYASDSNAEEIRRQFDTEEEVNEFAKKSAIQEWLYYGTSDSQARTIRHNGFQPKNGEYGIAIYTTPIQEEAKYWAGGIVGAKGGEPYIIRAKVHVNRPKIYDISQSGVEEQLKKERWPTKGTFIAHLRKQGYDALVIRCRTHMREISMYGGNQVIVFDPQNIMLVDDKKLISKPIETSVIKQGGADTDL